MAGETTAVLAQFASALKYEDIPQRTREYCKDILLDTLACAVAGHQGEDGHPLVAVCTRPVFERVAPVKRPGRDQPLIVDEVRAFAVPAARPKRRESSGIAGCRALGDVSFQGRVVGAHRVDCGSFVCGNPAAERISDEENNEDDVEGSQRNPPIS